jgi:hypothetical protein
MNYKVIIKKSSTNQKGYTITVKFFQDTRTEFGAIYSFNVKTKKEAEQWEIKNRKWLLNTSKAFVGV